MFPLCLFLALVHGTTAPHGPTGRKVKNKLKSAAAAAAGIAGTISQSGPLSTGATPSYLCGGVADSANALSRYRAYLAYQVRALTTFTVL